MKRSLLTTALAVGLGVFASQGTAQAAYLDSPVPGNAYITVGGLDWAWAFPLPAAAGLDPGYQASQGWRLPTAAELLSAPLATAFLFAGGQCAAGRHGPGLRRDLPGHQCEPERRRGLRHAVFQQLLQALRLA